MATGQYRQQLSGLVLSSPLTTYNFCPFLSSLSHFLSAEVLVEFLSYLIDFYNSTLISAACSSCRWSPWRILPHSALRNAFFVNYIVVVSFLSGSGFPPPTSKDLRDRRSDVEVSNQIPGLSAREQPNFFLFLLLFLFLSFCSSRIPNPETRPAVSRITTNHPFSPSSAVLHLVTQSHCVFTTPSFVLFSTLQHSWNALTFPFFS